jgi:hypothetical protein
MDDDNNIVMNELVESKIVEIKNAITLKNSANKRFIGEIND